MQQGAPRWPIGAQGATGEVTVTIGERCLAELGQIPGMTRCFVGDVSGGSYAYGVPEAVCGPLAGGISQTGPFCEAY